MHEAGCPTYFVSDFTWLNYWQPGLLSAILIAMGLGFGIIGIKSFSIVIPLSVSFFLGLIVLYTLITKTGVSQNGVAFCFLMLGLCVAVIFLVIILKRE